MAIPTLRASSKLGAQETIALVLCHELQMQRAGRALVSLLEIHVFTVRMDHHEVVPIPEFVPLSLSISLSLFFCLSLSLSELDA